MHQRETTMYVSFIIHVIHNNGFNFNAHRHIFFIVILSF